MNNEPPRYGRDATCERTACADLTAHVGGVHLNPTSEMYDGPDTSLNALPEAARKAGCALLGASRQDGWRRQVVDVALDAMGREILRLREQVAHVRVDRDRGIREAMKLAEDCEHHGATIRSEGHQAYYFSVLAEQHDAERVAWLGAALAIRDAFQSAATRAKVGAELAARVVGFVDAASRSADRARKRFNPPTFADCDRAGLCEHPPTKPHEACEQLRLALADEEAA